MFTGSDTSETADSVAQLRAAVHQVVCAVHGEVEGARLLASRQDTEAAKACFESACWERAYELRDAATSAVHRTHKAAELSAEADALEREAGTWSLIWFLLGDGAVAERENAASEADAREVMRARQTLGGDPASVYDTGVENPKPTPPPLSARINVRPAMSCSVFAPLTDSSSVSIARSVQNMRYFATRLELVTRAVV